MSEVLLEVKNLKKYCDTSKGSLLAVEGVSVTLERGKTLGMVGESGMGKRDSGHAAGIPPDGSGPADTGRLPDVLYTGNERCGGCQGCNFFR